MLALLQESDHHVVYVTSHPFVPSIGIYRENTTIQQVANGQGEKRKRRRERDRERDHDKQRQTKSHTQNERTLYTNNATQHTHVTHLWSSYASGRRKKKNIRKKEKKVSE